MTFLAPRAILRRILETTNLTHRQAAYLLGRAERTVTSQMNEGVIPRTFEAWLCRVREIRIHDGRATVVMDLPYGVKDGEYRRDDIVKIGIGVRKKEPRNKGSKMR